LGPLKRAGLAVAVADGVSEAKSAAQFITCTAGGRGAVREILELILRAQGKWMPFVAHYSE
jgi:3-deoxy-D-manno-octulosonate 8-phosphate phosphatase (KDO 8-P phosphatase)